VNKLIAYEKHLPKVLSEAEIKKRVDNFIRAEKRANSPGNEVVILHTESDGTRYVTKYFHLQGADFDTLAGLQTLQDGPMVAAGQVIGFTGTTGNVPAGAVPHLHFEVRKNSLNGPRICPILTPVSPPPPPIPHL